MVFLPSLPFALRHKMKQKGLMSLMVREQPLSVDVDKLAVTECLSSYLLIVS